MLLCVAAFFSCNKSIQSNARIDNRILDERAVLSAQQKESLFQQVLDLENKFGCQLAVLIVDSLGADETIEQLAARTIAQLKLGREGYDDGILISAVMSTRQLKIEAGPGLELILHDPATLRIVKESIAPNFRLGNYYEGLASGIGMIETLLEIDKDKIGQRP